MRDHTSIYVAPEYSEKLELVGWRYEIVRNNLLIAHGEGYATISEARLAGQQMAASRE